MKISCILNSSQIVNPPSDFIVFPEGSPRNELFATSLKYPASLVIGAVDEYRRSRALLLRHGKCFVDYLKVGTDGRTIGSRNLEQMPVLESANVCVAVLVCMDVDVVEFSAPVLERVRSSKAEMKLLCIPADMGPWWFSDNQPLPSRFEGMHVALSNSTRSYGQAGCKSFVTDKQGRKIATQSSGEPVHVDLTRVN